MNPQWPKSITTVIHHAIFALQINFQGGKQPYQGKETQEQKVKGAQEPNASKAPSTKKTKNQERNYKGKERLTLLSKWSNAARRTNAINAMRWDMYLVCAQQRSNRMELPRLLWLKS